MNCFYNEMEELQKCITSEEKAINSKGLIPFENLFDKICEKSQSSELTELSIYYEKCSADEKIKFNYCNGYTSYIYEYKLRRIYYYDQLGCRTFYHYKKCMLNAWNDCKIEKPKSQLFESLLNVVQGLLISTHKYHWKYKNYSLIIDSVGCARTREKASNEYEERFNQLAELVICRGNYKVKFYLSTFYSLY